MSFSRESPLVINATSLLSSSLMKFPTSKLRQMSALYVPGGLGQYVLSLQGHMGLTSSLNFSTRASSCV